MGLYGARLLAEQPAVRATIGGTSSGWRYFIAIVTYVINVPLTYFVRALIGPGSKDSVRWVSRAVSTFAIAAILVDLALSRSGAANTANKFLVLILIAVAFGNVLHASRIGRPRRC